MKKQMRRLLGIIISSMLLITYAFPVMAADPVTGHNHHSTDTSLPKYVADDAYTITLTKPKDDKLDNSKAKYGAYQIFSGTVPAATAENAPSSEDLKDPGTDGTALPITDIKWGNAFGEIGKDTWQKNIVNFVYALAKAPSGTYSYAFKDFTGFEAFAGSGENELADEYYTDPKDKENLDNVKFDKLAIEVAEVLEKNHDHEWLQAFTDILGGYAAGGEKYSQGNYVTQYYAGTWNAEGTQYEINVPAGYYMILDLSTIDEESADDYSEAYSARMLFVANNVTQELKSSVPQLDKKIVRDDEAEYETEAAGVGDTVKFKLTGTLPTNIDNYLGGYKYIFTDNLSKGLTLNRDSIKITVTGLWKANSSGAPEWYEGDPLTIDSNSFSGTATNHHHITSSVYTIDVNPGAPTATGGQTLTVSFPCLKEIVITNDSGTYTLGYNKDGENYKTSQIYVEYTATVNEFAVVSPKKGTEINGNKNTAQLEYSNNPQAYDDTDMTTFDDATVYTFGLDITKVDSAEFTKDPNAETAKLPGAVFALVRPNPDSEATDKYQIATFENGSIDTWVNLSGATETNLQDTVKKYLYDDDGNGSLKPTFSAYVVTSDSKGKINITGLNDGVKYTMVETEAPKGYATIDPFSFTLTAAKEKDSEGNVTDEYNGLLDSTAINSGESKGTLSLKEYVIDKNEAADSNGLSELTVANFAYENLPSTGGIGTYIFYIVGGIVVLGAVVLLFLSRKKKVTE